MDSLSLNTRSGFVQSIPYEVGLEGEGQRKHDFSALLMDSVSPFSQITKQEKINYLSRADYDCVRNHGYEKGLLTSQGMVVHALNSIFVEREVLNFREKLKDVPEKEFQSSLESKLSEILLDGLSSKKIDISYYKPAGDNKRGYGKYLLYSNPDKSNPFCFQLFVFGEGQKTRLHNHIAPCSTTVLQGAIEESLYEAALGTRKGEPLAKFVSSSVREQGSLAGFDSEQLNEIHQIRNVNKNKGDGYAITVHYYKDMDGVELEMPEASSLRKTSADLIGKTNAAELFRKIKLNLV